MCSLESQKHYQFYILNIQIVFCTNTLSKRTFIYILTYIYIVRSDFQIFMVNSIDKIYLSKFEDLKLKIKHFNIE